jgi:hypothetical protein
VSLDEALKYLTKIGPWIPHEIRTCRPVDNIHDYKWVFIVAQLLHGVGACPMWILGVTYLDENLMPDQSSLYIGTYYAFSVIGPALGYLGGGSLLDLHTDIDVPGLNITITSDHPNFVSSPQSAEIR